MKKLQQKVTYMKQIYIYPHDRENVFLSMQKKSIENAGLYAHHNFYAFYKTEYFLFNWYENVKTKREFIKKILKLYFLRILRKKILWVVHNKKSHLNISKNNNEDKYNLALMKKLFIFSFKTIILCDETKNVLKDFLKSKYTETKIVKIPHPNYIDFYKIAKPVSKKTNCLNFLFIGLIKRYKKIELLIDCFNKISDKNIFLKITGKCTDESFEKELKSRIINENITFDFNYIPNEQIPELIQENDIVLLPYSLESSLNSGVIFLAFSLGRTVCSSYIGSLKEYKDKDFFYEYTYSSNDEHVKNLTSTIKKIITDWNADKNILNIKGRKAFEMVKNENSLLRMTEIFCKEIMNTTPPYTHNNNKQLFVQQLQAHYKLTRKKHIDFLKNNYYPGEKYERA